MVKYVLVRITSERMETMIVLYSVYYTVCITQYVGIVRVQEIARFDSIQNA